jgi:addiction module HigA family antidote
MPHKKPTDPVHPGEILLEDFMKPASLSMNGLAVQLRVPASRIHAIVNETRDITADTALRLGRFFSTSSEFWMNLQRDFDLRVAANQSRREIEQLVRPPERCLIYSARRKRKNRIAPVGWSP